MRICTNMDVLIPVVDNLDERFTIISGYEFYCSNEKRTSYHRIFGTTITTDGMIKEVGEPQTIKDVKISFAGEDVECDLAEFKNITLSNANFVIKIYEGQEAMDTGRIAGIFDVVKKIEVYVKDGVSRKTLRLIRDIINDSQKDVREFSSIMQYAAPDLEPATLPLEETSDHDITYVNRLNLARKYVDKR